MGRPTAWMVARLRRWLGVADDWSTVSGLFLGVRRDLDAIVATLQEQRGEMLANDAACAKSLGDAVGLLRALDRRLRVYETTVPSIARARKAVEAAEARQRRKAARAAKQMAVAKDAPDSMTAQREAAPEVAGG